MEEGCLLVTRHKTTLPSRTWWGLPLRLSAIQTFSTLWSI